MGLYKHLCTPENVVIAMYDYYKTGHSIRSTAQHFGLSQSAVFKAFKRAGYHIRSRSHAGYLANNLSEETKAMYQDYLSGMSHQAIAKKYQYSKSAIADRFKRYRLPSRTAWEWRTK